MFFADKAKHLHVTLGLSNPTNRIAGLQLVKQTAS
jgi:hypothetical protein